MTRSAFTDGFPHRARCMGQMLTCSVMVGWLLCALAAFGQSYTVESIDFYGLRHLSEQAVQRVLPIKAGDQLIGIPALQKEIVRRVEAVPGVQKAHVNFVGFQAGTMLVYIGVEEKGAVEATFRFRKAPEGTVRLPQVVLDAGKEFQTQLLQAIQHNDAMEDRSYGYSLMHYPAARAVQAKFLAYAAVSQHVAQLRDVLHHSSDGEQRALAAQILGYAPDKQKVIPDLVDAISDPDEEVRNNAIRALGCMAMYAQSRPQSGLKIPTMPMVRLLNSPIWTDRNKSTMVLMALSQNRDPELLKSMKAAALSSLAEMARWHSPGHAAGAFIILGRIGGLSEEAIMAAWQNRDIQTVLDAAKSHTLD